MMNSLGNILSNNPFKRAIIKGVESAEIVEKTNEILARIFGPSIAEHANAAYIRDNCLHIACLSSAAAQEIKFRERQILEELETTLPGSKVNRIAYMV